MLTLEEFAQRVYGGMVRIREGYEHHGKQCRCHICEGARIIRVAFDELERSGQWSSIPKCFRTERTVEPMNSLIMPHWHCKLCGYPLPIGTRQPGFHQTCPSCKTEYAWHPFGEYDLPNITSTKPKPSRVDGMLRDLRKGIDDMLGEGVSSGNPTLIHLAEAIMGSVNKSKPTPSIVPLEAEDMPPSPAPPNPYGETKIDPVDIDAVEAAEEDDEVTAS